MEFEARSRCLFHVSHLASKWVKLAACKYNYYSTPQLRCRALAAPMAISCATGGVTPVVDCSSCPRDCHTEKFAAPHVRAQAPPPWSATSVLFLVTYTVVARLLVLQPEKE